MPAFKLANDQVEELPKVTGESSDLMQQITRMMDDKLLAAQTVTSELIANMSGNSDKGKNNVESNELPNSTPSSSGVSEHVLDPNLGMPMNFHAGQSPHP